MDLVQRYLDFLATGEMAPGAFAEDVFLDMNVPSWRVQFQGHAAVTASRAGLGRWQVQPGPVSVTGDGFVVETAIAESGTLSSRSVSVVTVADGRIAKVAYYCTGTWDAATRARHADEVTLLVP
jgi:ketosteroid isomerase-like protein